MRYRWILFDADGTLFDYDRAESEALFEVWADAGLERDDELLAVYREINGALWRLFEQGGIRPAEIKSLRFERFVERLGLDHDPEALSEAYVAALGRQTWLLPGAQELLDGLAERASLALITNGLSSVQRSRLSVSTIGHHFESVVISEEIGAAKPDPRIFAESLAQMGDPDRGEVLMVGDNLLADIGGAIDFGLEACWLNEDGRAGADGIEPTYEISRLEQLWDVVS